MKNEDLSQHQTGALGKFGYPVAVALLFLLACAPRLSYYLTGRALWFDEAALCVNVLDRGFGGLLEPLAFKQVAPPLYLWSLKLCTLVAGETVYAVRFPSLVAGLATLVLFWSIARRMLSGGGALLAFLMVVMSQHLINYAGEAKPYAADVAIALSVVWMAILWEARPGTWSRCLRFGAVLAVMVWYSYPAVFVIAGVGLSQLLSALCRRRYQDVGYLSVLYALSALSFLMVFALVILPSRGDSETMTYMNNYWRHGFMPFPPTRLWDLRWYRERVFMFFEMPGGFTLQGLALFIWVTGLMSLCWRKPWYAAWIVAPIVLTLLASSQKIYPFHGRMTLFLVPAIFFLMGEGVNVLGKGQSPRLRRVVLGLILVLLMAQPMVRATRMFVAPSRHHELEKVLAYAESHWQEGDQLYLREGDYISYRFLKSDFDFPDEVVHFEIREGRPSEELAFFEEDLATQLGSWGRVWFPMAYDDPSAVEDYVAFLHEHGKPFDRHVARGAIVYGLLFNDIP